MSVCCEHDNELDGCPECDAELEAHRERQLEEEEQRKAALLAARNQPRMDPAEGLARAFHESYERNAPAFNYTTRKASAVPWADVPESNKNLMIHVCKELLGKGLHWWPK